MPFTAAMASGVSPATASSRQPFVLDVPSLVEFVVELELLLPDECVVPSLVDQVPQPLVCVFDDPLLEDWPRVEPYDFDVPLVVPSDSLIRCSIRRPDTS